MKSETLLDKSISNYKAASILLNNLEHDELFINIICYNLQQSAELFLKHILEINGIKYSRTHDIAYLISEIEDNNIQLSITDRFKLSAEKFTSWESKTRYLKNFRVAKGNMLLGFEVLEELFKENNIFLEP